MGWGFHSLQIRGWAFRSSSLNHGDVVGSCLQLMSQQVLQQRVSMGRYAPSTGPQNCRGCC